MTADIWFVLRIRAAEAYGRPVADGFLVQQGSTAMRNGTRREKEIGKSETDYCVAEFWCQIPTPNVIALTETIFATVRARQVGSSMMEIAVDHKLGLIPKPTEHSSNALTAVIDG